jgi:DNA (cytosine-5)-methyltransferase 1
MKILNLFAGIGGNRRLWSSDHQITSVEYDSKTAYLYNCLYPNDEIIIDDAFDYLIKNMETFDIIWASPPCQSHTKLMSLQFHQGSQSLPDMRLYSIIIYLQKWFKGKYIVENVCPYYNPLIKPSIKLERHLFWTNFIVASKKIDPIKIGRHGYITNEKLMRQLGFDSKHFKLFTKNEIRQWLYNCVNPEVGKYLLHQALKQTQKSLLKN